MRAAPCARAPRVGVKNGVDAIVLITIMLALAGAAEKTLTPKSTAHLTLALSKNLGAIVGAYSTSDETRTLLKLTRHLISLAKEAGQHDVGEVSAALTDQKQLKNCGVTSHKTHD